MSTIVDKPKRRGPKKTNIETTVLASRVPVDFEKEIDELAALMVVPTLRGPFIYSLLQDIVLIKKHEQTKSKSDVIELENNTQVYNITAPDGNIWLNFKTKTEVVAYELTIEKAAHLVSSLLKVINSQKLQ